MLLQLFRWVVSGAVRTYGATCVPVFVVYPRVWTGPGALQHASVGVGAAAKTAVAPPSSASEKTSDRASFSISTPTGGTITLGDGGHAKPNVTRMVYQHVHRDIADGVAEVVDALLRGVAWAQCPS